LRGTNVEYCNKTKESAVLICTKMFNDYAVEYSRKQSYFVEYEFYRE